MEPYIHLSSDHWYSIYGSLMLLKTKSGDRLINNKNGRLIVPVKNEARSDL